MGQDRRITLLFSPVCGIKVSKGANAIFSTLGLSHIWLAISFTICDIYDEHAKEAEFVSPDQATRVLPTILSFIDDITNQ
eukprot:11173234-Ditylum_brightwellii.AAC.1